MLHGCECVFPVTLYTAPLAVHTNALLKVCVSHVVNVIVASAGGKSNTGAGAGVATL